MIRSRDGLCVIALQDGEMSWVAERGSEFVGLVHGEVTPSTDMSRIFYTESFYADEPVNTTTSLLKAISDEHNMIITETSDDAGEVCYEWRSNRHAGYCRAISQCIEDRLAVIRHGTWPDGAPCRPVS